MPDYTHFALVDTVSGMIEQAGSTTASIADVNADWDLGADIIAVETETLLDNPRDYYGTVSIDNGQPVVGVSPREDMTPTLSGAALDADGADTVVVSGLPNPCSVSVSGPLSGSASFTDTTLTLTVAREGVYTLTFTSEPVYRPWSCTVEAS